MAININAKTTGVGGLETSADNSGEINIQSGGSTVMSVTSSGVSVTGSFSQNGAVYSTQPSFRNLLINGDMQIAQRGTSATGLGNGDAGYYTIDRWYFEEAGAPSAEVTMSQDTDVPTGQGFGYSLKFAVTTAQATMVTTDQVRFEQRIEAQNLQHLKYGTSSAETLTLSFWIKSNVTGTYIMWVYSPDGARSISISYTINAADTWEKKTITIDGDDAGTINNDNGEGLRCVWYLAAGPSLQASALATTWRATPVGSRCTGQVNLMASTSNYINITGVQLEVGSTATEFEHLPYDVELARCQRYYQVMGGGTGSTFIIGGNAANTSAHYTWIPFATHMRSFPTVTENGAWQSTNVSSVAYVYEGYSGFAIQVNPSGSGRYFYGTNSSDDYLKAEAEL